MSVPQPSAVVRPPARAKLADRNTLNDLDGKAWVRFTKSWFVDPPRRKTGPPLPKHRHPASFPESLVYEFLRFFTRAAAGQVVVDPFCGVGSALAAVDQVNDDFGGDLRGYGVELNPVYAAAARARTRCPVSAGDAALFDVGALPLIDFIITSPPYWSMLRKKTGHVNRKREREGLDTVYSESPADLGNIADYGVFIRRVSDVLGRFADRLKPGAFCVVILACLNDRGSFYPLPYDFARAFGSRPGIVWKGERIWCQDRKKPMPYGYPYSFVSRVAHHSCLIFRRAKTA